MKTGIYNSLNNGQGSDYSDDWLSLLPLELDKAATTLFSFM
jgi:hypothetical protein